MADLFKSDTFADVSHFPNNPPRLISGVECHQCSFLSCSFGSVYHNARSVVRASQFINCKTQGCSIEGAILDDVLIDGLKTPKMHMALACAYKHVVLRGKIGSLLLTSHVIASNDDAVALQQKFDRANKTFYVDVDWALDIREAEFKSFDARGVPARLIRRDASTQALITRAKLLTNDAWRRIDIHGYEVPLDAFLRWGFDDMVLVAPKASTRFSKVMDVIARLRAEGVAEAS